MNKGKRYKRSNKRLTNFLWFYISLSILLILGYTFSRYLAKVEPEGITTIAKFNVKVNDIVVGDGENFELKLSPNSNTQDNKIAPEQEGYFEINIDPTGTEVSLEYEFDFNLENLYKDIHLTRFTANDGEPINITDNVVKGDMNLPNKERGFLENEKTSIKVYWEWTGEDIINPVITDKDISVISTIRQKIN